MRKTDDRFELNSVLGRAMKRKYWKFSFFMNFRTQFSDAYDYNDNFIGINENFPTAGFLNLLIGVLVQVFYGRKATNSM